MEKSAPLLILGEVVVDFTLAQIGAPCKMRLGGIVHAARGLWAAGLEYSVAAVCPQYLLGEVQQFLVAHGCKEFHWIGNVIGAPNVMVIGDPIETSHQGYEDLLRDTKQVELNAPWPSLANYTKIIVFPGKFSINTLIPNFSPEAKFTFDVAYDINDLSSLHAFRDRIEAIIISTSSELFMRVGNASVLDLIAAVKSLNPDVLLLKENRGGSRLFHLPNSIAEEIPATLGKTVNSVGVGDAYSGVMTGLSDRGWSEAAWRGCQVATAYSQTTYPDDLKRDVQRSFKLSLDTLRDLGGTTLPWHDRQSFSIYLAGPDFSYTKKPELERAIASLTYHNFKVRRPIQENGEIKRPASHATLTDTYNKDYELLMDCDVVFAIPLERDPGTLVEVGMAIAMGKPVITYDPRNENDNTMVIVGSVVYSPVLEECLNGVFLALAKLRAEKK